MPTTYSDEVRARCRSLYCFRGRDPKEIAALMPPTVSTIRRWRREEDWDDMKIARSVSGQDVAEQLRRQVYKIIAEANEEGRLLDNGEVDRIRKMRKDIKELDDSELRIAHTLDAFDTFNDWLADHYPDLRKDVVPAIMEFTRELVQDA